ncbi:putative glycosyl transferase [Bythopirellula goksoeyrii]|uniref:Putative glycosyl transferase n=2 Tax=Bythopirellula goksoeyrii TaxID=1400387 RepID=A0A5B9QB06_9BACT|nr:putative glycosyl transferase [Bythopirellula goksoeyrii]
MHDAAAELARRGYRVLVYAASRGYDDPSRKYLRRETLDGVTIRRLPLSSFGKKSIKVRLLGQSLFLLQVIVRGLFTRRLDRILVSTSPPMASTAAVFIQFFRRVPITFWAMDINPDQIVAMGQAREGSFVVRVFDWINRTILKRARGVVALDRFMAARLEAKSSVGDRMAIMPPWPHESHLEPVDHANNPFRKEHGLDDKFVIMYSGNISPAHPVITILEAARKIQDDPRIVFLFIGGGNGKKQIDEFIQREQVSNVRTLPYQPLDQIKYSLSAADVHLVAMGTEMVGIVHPCKVYGAMAVARPVLLLGPMESHVGELLQSHDIGWQVNHGDVANAEACIRQLAATPAAELAVKGNRGKQLIEQELSMKTLCGKFCDVVEWT